MKRICIYISALLILTVGSVFASGVTNITLSHQDGFTVSHINVEGTIRFSHQTEVAKDGKPFRVIVDVLAATHNLGAKVFTDLPPCEVKGIRTSQFAVKPEKVVRVVYDMNHETVYRVDTDEHGIVIFFPDKNSKPFAGWSSKDFVAKLKKAAPSVKTKPATMAKTTPTPATGKSKKTVAEINKEIGKDHLASLQATSTPSGQSPKKTTNIKPSKKTHQPVVPKVTKPDMFADNMVYGPFLDGLPTEPEPPKNQVGSISDKAIATPQKSVEKPVRVAKVQKETKQPAKKTNKLAKKQPKTVAPQAKASEFVGPVVPDKPVVKSTKKVSPPVSKSVPTVADKGKTPAKKKQTPVNKKAGTTKQYASNEPAKPQVKTTTKDKASPKVKKQAAPKSGTVKPTPVKHEQEKASPEVDQKPQPVKKPTSRFRRSPTRPTKIKGTLVAEFPKRLVIKYKPRGNDPFETLINESKTYNSPVERKIPNVEGIHLVGIIESDEGENSALFEDNDGYGYILREGDKVRKGYVLRVEEDKVYFQIFEYGWSRTLALTMEEE